MNHELIKPPNSVETTSRSLLERIKDGDQLAWQHLVLIYGPIVSFWIRQHHLQGDDAQDISQEVFLAIIKNIDRFERAEGVSKFRRWLKVITQSKVNDHFRKSQRIKTVGGDSTSFTIDEIPDSDSDIGEIEWTPTENAVIVQSVIRLIRPEFRETTWQSFWLTVVDGMNATQVADKLKMTSDAVRKNKSRVMARFQQVLSSEII